MPVAKMELAQRSKPSPTTLWHGEPCSAHAFEPAQRLSPAEPQVPWKQCGTGWGDAQVRGWGREEGARSCLLDGYWGGRNRCWDPRRGSHLLQGGTAGPWHPTLSTCCFIAGQAAGTGIPSRCRQDVGGNTWKSWHRLEGLCNSSGSRATPPQSHEVAHSWQLPRQRLLVWGNC